jgi:hypothetical protein
MVLRPQQSANKFTNPLNYLVAAGAPLDFLDNRAAHDRAVCVPPDIAYVPRRRNSKTNRHRQIGAPAHPANQLFRGPLHFFPRSGYACARDCVKKSARAGRYLQQTLVAGGWRDEKDWVDGTRVQKLLPIGCFFRDQVGDEDTIHSRGSRFTRESFESELQERIEITEKHYRDFYLSSRRSQAAEKGRQRGAVPQGALRSALNHGPVGDGITEGHADFNQVCARSSEFVKKKLRRPQIRITGSDERDQGPTAVPFQIRKFRFDPTHAFPAVMLARLR